MQNNTNQAICPTNSVISNIKKKRNIKIYAYTFKHESAFNLFKKSYTHSIFSIIISIFSQLSHHFLKWDFVP